MNVLFKIFTNERQFVKEISDNLSNTDIDLALEFGINLLNDAKRCLEEGSFFEIGKSREDVIIDISIIEYNVNQFMAALLYKEKADVIMSCGRVMFLHAN